MSPTQRSSHPITDKNTWQGTTSGLALFRASDLFPQIEAITAVTDQARAIASITSNALAEAASALSLMSDLSSSVLDVQCGQTFWETAGAAVAPTLLDTELWSGLEEVRSTALASIDLAHSVFAEVQPILNDPIISDIGIEREL